MSELQGYLNEDEVPIGRQDISALFGVLRHSRSARPLYFLASGLLTASAVAAIVAARLLAPTIDRGLLAGDVYTALWSGSLVLTAEFGAVILAWGGRWALAIASSRTVLTLRQELFAKTERLPMSYFDHHPVGRTVTRLTHDVEGLEQFFGASLGRLLSSTFLVLLTFAIMLFDHPLLGVMVVLAMLPAVFVTLVSRNTMLCLNRSIARKSSAINATLSEYLNGWPLIRAFGLETWSTERYEATVSDHLGTMIEFNIANAWIRPLISMLTLLPIPLLLWFGGQAVREGALELGILVVFVRYCERFSSPLLMLVREIHLVQTALASAERIATYLAEPEEDEVLGPNGSQRPHLFGAVGFEKVSMNYEQGPEILHRVSFTCEVGERLGITGTTGSGKSTAIGLLVRLYAHTEGRVTLDGLAVENLDRVHLRSQVGYLGQEVVVFRGTVAENLDPRGSKPEAELLEAASTTGLDRVMHLRGLTLASQLLDQGANLSAGERRLVALTRVVLEDPAILVLDEATADLDETEERMLLDSLVRLMHGRTMLVVAHRPATLLRCDRVVVFAHGVVVEQGRPKDLLIRDGAFSSLFNNAMSQDEVEAGTIGSVRTH